MDDATSPSINKDERKEEDKDLHAHSLIEDGRGADYHVPATDHRCRADDHEGNDEKIADSTTTARATGTTAKDANGDKGSGADHESSVAGTDQTEIGYNGNIITGGSVHYHHTEQTDAGTEVETETEEFNQPQTLMAAAANNPPSSRATTSTSKSKMVDRSGGWDYPPPVASPVGRRLNRDSDKIWHPLPVEWRTPQRLFTLSPSATTSSTPAGRNYSSSLVSSSLLSGGVGESGIGGDAASTTTASTSVSTRSTATTSLAGTRAETEPRSEDYPSNTTDQPTASYTPFRSCLCAPIILQNEYILVAVNDETLVLYGNFDIQHDQHIREGQQNDDNENSSLVDGDDTRDRYMSLPSFSTPPLVQWSLSALVVEAENNDSSSIETTHAALDWTIIQMVWIGESNTLYVLTDDSHILQLHINLPSSKSRSHSLTQPPSKEPLSKPVPTIELEQQWMSDQMGVTCMTVQHDQWIDVNQSDSRSEGSVVDMLYLGFNSGMIQGWKVHRRIHSRHTITAPSSRQTNRSPTMTRRPSGGGTKTFVGPSASSLMSNRRPSFSKVEENLVPPPTLMWTGSFPSSTIRSMIVLVRPKKSCNSEEQSKSHMLEGIDVPPNSAYRSAESSDEVIEISKKTSEYMLARENSFASVHSSSGPSDPSSASPRTKRSGVIPPSPPPRPPSLSSSSVRCDTGNSAEYQDAFLVVVTTQTTSGQQRPLSVNEDDSAQPTSSMLQILDLHRILFRDGFGPFTSGTNKKLTASADDSQPKSVISLFNYKVNWDPRVDLIDSSTAIFENDDGRLPQPSQVLSFHGADLTVPIFAPSLSTKGNSKVNLDGTSVGEIYKQQSQLGSRAGIMFPDGTTAIISTRCIFNDKDESTCLGLLDDFDQFLLPFPAIGTGTVEIYDKVSSDLQSFLVCCVRGGTCYLLPTSSVEDDRGNPAGFVKRRLRMPIHAFAYPHDVDTDQPSIYVESFAAGNLVVDSNGSKVPVTLFSSPGGTVDVYSCQLLPPPSKLPPCWSSADDAIVQKESSVDDQTNGEEEEDFVPHSERMVLEEMVEDGTLEVFLDVIREIHISGYRLSESLDNTLQDEDLNQYWKDVLEIASNEETNILSYLDGDPLATVDSISSEPVLRPVRKLLLSLALQSSGEQYSSCS